MDQSGRRYGLATAVEYSSILKAGEASYAETYVEL
jgi:hypothetical protein